MNIPNSLTLLRIFLIPAFVILLMDKMFSYALMVFILAGTTDALDGFIARYFNQKTALGACLDPVADKLLITASFICLSMLKLIPYGVMIIVISRDVLIVTGIAILFVMEVPFTIMPSFVSKCTTTAQLVTVFFVLLYVSHPSLNFVGKGIHYLYMLTVIFAIASGFHYTVKGFALIQEDNAHGKPPEGGDSSL